MRRGLGTGGSLEFPGLLRRLRLNAAGCGWLQRSMRHGNEKPAALLRRMNPKKSRRFYGFYGRKAEIRQMSNKGQTETGGIFFARSIWLWDLTVERSDYCNHYRCVQRSETRISTAAEPVGKFRWAAYPDRVSGPCGTAIFRVCRPSCRGLFCVFNCVRIFWHIVCKFSSIMIISVV